MAETVGQHSVAAFTSPVNGTTPIDANTVRGNDNTVRSAYVDHDADPGIHVQSSSLASRPVAGTVGRKWITVNSGRYQLWYDDGSRWHEVASDAVNVDCLADANLTKGDVVKITGFNNGQNLPTVNKVSASTDTAFGIVENTVTSGNIVQIVNTGLIEDVDTNGYAVGTILYPNSSGGFTTTKPTSGNYQPAGYVLRGNTNNGVLYVEFSAPRIVERSDNTASTIVLRDASGNFSAGTITAGALTSTGLVTFASLKGTGATTVTNILDEDNMASDSATALATQQSIKAYVDSKVATVDTLAEVLANGNTTGANDIIVNAGQKIRTPLVAAQDGTSAITIANTTGALTLNTALADSNLATISTAGKVSNSATTATSANTASAIVARDASGNFTAGTITAALTGNASTATTLQTARNINGVSFNGSADITVTAAAGTLTGNTLASGVTASSLTSVGTLTSLTVSGNTYVATTSGNLGVGTTSPFNDTGYKSIDLRGSTGGEVVLGSASVREATITADGTNGMIFNTVNATPLRFYTQGGERASIDASGNLAVDTNTLYVDATNNRVGVGTATPTQALNVNGITLIEGSAQGNLIIQKTGTNGFSLFSNAAGTLGFYDQSAGATRMAFDSSGNLAVDTNTLYVDAANNRVGVGTASPLSTLHVESAFGSTGNALRLQNTTATAVNNRLDLDFWFKSTAWTNARAARISALVTGDYWPDAAITFSTHDQSSPTGVAERMRLDASGNLGLGATPSAWGSTVDALQMGTASFAASATGNTPAGSMYVNSFFDGTNFKYVANGEATRYGSFSGQHVWYTAPSGTAGNNISFTQAMTLDASGNLGVGVTPTEAFCVKRGASTAAYGEFAGNNNTPGSTSALYGQDAGGNAYAWNRANLPLLFGTNNTERARITAGGWAKFADNGTYVNATGDYHEFSRSASSTTPVIIAWNKLTTSDNSFIEFGTEGSYTARGSITYNRGAGQVAYNVTSDERLKDNIADAEDAGAMVDAMQVRQFDWKETGNHLDYGFVAQELHAVVPHAVTVPEDEDKFWSVDYSKLVPMLVKEIQSLRARVAALEA